jgi:hypothetical protein
MIDPQQQWHQYRLDFARHLKGLRLQFCRYTQPSDTWDHDHCAGCNAKFAEFEAPDILHHGYTTCDDYVHGPEYDWICETCFQDLRQDMQWTVVQGTPPA